GNLVRGHSERTCPACPEPVEGSSIEGAEESIKTLSVVYRQSSVVSMFSAASKYFHFNGQPGGQ
ncbi:MAG: hypothetical protein KAV87_44280, partial [Desulfobacteraceae bacterium]|nr:hypothetical protein [Desulfobacteraceae bacterium]